MQHATRWAVLLAAMVFAPSALATEATDGAPADKLLPLPASVQALPGKYVPASPIVVCISDAGNAELRDLGSPAAGLQRDAW